MPKKTPSDYEIERSAALLLLAKFLLIKADERGQTHGEKHLLISVALMLIDDSHFILTGEYGRSLARWNGVQAEDIPL